MNKYLIIPLAAIAMLASCSKVQTAGEKTERAISFQAAGYATKLGITGTQLPTSESFGVYAWTDNTSGPYFMDNEVVSFQEDELWKTATPYYWPPTQTVDFFCFYPAKMKELTVDKTKITFAAYDVASTQQDVMYADKAVGFADNPENVPSSVSGYDGVPAMFHHALAKLSIKVVLAYNHKEEVDGTVTDWSVTVNSMSLKGVFKKGDCELVLADTPEIGLVAWNRPSGNVWTHDDSLIEEKNLLNAATELDVDKAITALPEMFVLPQTLAAGQQQVALNVTIKTRRNGADFLTETYDVVRDLLVPGSLEAWQMNHSLTYSLSFNPLRSGVADPVDPDDPDLTDATICFAPAAGGWDAVDVAAVINL